MTDTTPEEVISSLKTLRANALTFPGIIGQRVAAILETSAIRVEAAMRIAKNQESMQPWPIKLETDNA